MGVLAILGLILVVVGVVWLLTGSLIAGIVAIVVGLILIGTSQNGLRL
jgi:hypothetical protein